MTEPLHIAEDDTPMRDDYAYTSTGVGVRKDLVHAVLMRWAAASPNGDPARTLASVNDGLLNSVENIARMAVQATLEALAAPAHRKDET